MVAARAARALARGPEVGLAVLVRGGGDVRDAREVLRVAAEDVREDARDGEHGEERLVRLRADRVALGDARAAREEAQAARERLADELAEHAPQVAARAHRGHLRVRHGAVDRPEPHRNHGCCCC